MTLSFITPVQEGLREVEILMRDQADGNHPDLAAALEHLIASGGKRVRPTVTLLTGKMLGAEWQRLLYLATAIEMLHTATLVHDDLIDGALLRRGMVTLNAEWSPAATVLTGDFIFAKAAELAAATESVAVMQLFAKTLSVLVNGEITQLFASRGVANREDYYHRIHAKTASMFELATGAAALLSPVDEVTASAVRRFGYEIGMAFQIVDDVLDFTAEQTTLGKPVASDLRQGLITLPTLYFLEAHPNHPDLQILLKNNGHAEKSLQRILHAIRQSGGIEKSLEEAEAFIQRALNILMNLPDTPERQSLADLARYIVYREM
jgi:geranylgeranyl pyrophosphate synthase